MYSINRNKITTIIAVVLGLIYLVSGLAKAYDNLNFADLIARYNEKLIFFSPVVIGAEVVLGVVLILNIFPKLIGKISFFFLLFLSLMFTYGFFFLGLEDCGCMGTYLKISPVASFLRNFVMMLLSYFLWKSNATDKGVSKTIALPLAIALGFASIIFSGMKIRNDFYLAPKLVHRSYKELAILDSVEMDSNKTYLVFLYKPECPHCRRATAMINSFKKEGIVDSIFGFTSSSETLQQIEDYEKELLPDFTTFKRSPKELRKITKSIPLAFLIKNDTIDKFYSAEYFSERYKTEHEEGE